MQKIGDEFYTFIIGCEDPKACTILLRGASKDVLNEVSPSMILVKCSAEQKLWQSSFIPLVREQTLAKQTLTTLFLNESAQRVVSRFTL